MLLFLTVGTSIQRQNRARVLSLLAFYRKVTLPRPEGRILKSNFRRILASSLLITYALILPGMTPTVQARTTSSPNFAELVWGNNQLWNMIAPPARFPIPANMMAHEDFYEEAPQHPGMGFPSSPQSSDCEHLGLASTTTTCHHDHTVPIPNGNHGGFTVVWHVFLVLCVGNAASVTLGSNSCVAETVSGTLLGGGSVTLNLAQTVIVGGSTVPLTSDSAVEAASAAGIVTIFDSGVTFICPIQHT